MTSPHRTAETGMAWFRGNVHAHTADSDGDSPPGEVARWYRDQGYGFLAITDHNRLTPTDHLQWELDREAAIPGAASLQLIRGEEVTDRLECDGRVYELHVNALGASGPIGPQGGGSKAEVLNRCVAAVQEAGGLAVVNHPNFRWSVAVEDLLDVPKLSHMEIHNAHPEANNLGSMETPGNEGIWDAVLSAGRRVFGVASDDSHVFRRFHAGLPNPGQAWVACRAASGAADDVLASLSRGDFYCSTGVELSDVRTEDATLSVQVRPRYDHRYLIRFVGTGGRTLEEVEATRAHHRLAPEELYVRAEVVGSQGACAWTQPVFGPAEP